MKNCVLVVYSNPVDGREDEYNDWYNRIHLPDVLKVPGFVSAQRFEISGSAGFGNGGPGNTGWRYLAIYEFATDDPAAAFAALMERAGGPDMVLSEAMDMTHYSAQPWVAVTDKLNAKN